MRNVQMTIEEKEVVLLCLLDGQGVAQEVWRDENDLLEVFFVHLEVLLENADSTTDEIDSYSLDAENASGYTTARIAKTLISTLNFSLETSHTR